MISHSYKKNSETIVQMIHTVIIQWEYKEYIFLFYWGTSIELWPNYIFIVMWFILQINVDYCKKKMSVR